jgi:hypothetical protein
MIGSLILQEGRCAKISFQLILKKVCPPLEIAYNWYLMLNTERINQLMLIQREHINTCTIFALCYLSSITIIEKV